MDFILKIITGVGFLGGGVILREGFNVRGLNTAAVGVLISGGYILFGVAGALTILLSNIVLRPIARKMYNLEPNVIDEECIYEISIKCAEKEEFHISFLCFK
ncbi:MgtC/SapB family protein [Clostridium sp. OS1-26]|uniref:MgtC/SapB family protein n=1 Tax=Clostridium sp. OS1-26 TaxID=3070681 RepID=UPI0027DEF3F0|nr:MgtC/SapB family protein [Clostridium sp. OS1-26]WML37411.1 hypothetical protein RCG18_12820 [Clostridium sp. OS1-26]